MDDRIEIKHSHFLVTAIFTAFSVFFLVMAVFGFIAAQSLKGYLAAAVVLGIGVLIFGLGMRWLRNMGPALIIDDIGITDKVSFYSAGCILWDDIVKVGWEDRGEMPFIVLYVKNPDWYADKRRRPLKNKAMQINKLYVPESDKYGLPADWGPLYIEAGGLGISRRKILQILNDKLEQFKMR